MAKSIISQLKDKGKVTRGWIGVSIQPVTKDLADSFGLPAERGALVSEVTPDSPAEKGGVKSGDIIISFDNKAIKEMNDLPRLVAATAAGRNVNVKVIRDGREENLALVIEKMKEGDDDSSPDALDKLGLAVKDLTKELAASLRIKDTNGVVVTDVKPDGLAMSVGIQRGDVLKELNGIKITKVEEYEKALSTLKKDKVLRLLVKHGNSSRYVAIKVE